MKKFYTVNIVLLVFMLSTLISYGQTPKEKAQITRHYNKTKIQQLQLKFSAEYLKQKEEALKAAKTNNWPVIIEKEGSYAELQRLALDGSPIYYTTRNQDAAISTRTDYINIGGASGLALDGQNMTAHVWDGGIARSTHQEYDGSGGSNRFSIGDGTATIDDHATHVTGTMIASGVETASKGMAPRAQAIGYDWNGDLSEVTIAAMDGMLISNHSYGEDSFSLPDYYFGAYTTISRDWDDLFYNAPYYLMVMAGGNTGNVNYNDSPLEGNSTYDKFVGFEICKNNIVVANAQDAIIDASGNLVSANINSSSSQGPTDDYRIKPDITGNGTGVYSTGSDADAHYDTKTGTSMASPNVAGSLLLLQQHANNLNGNFMRAATLKGLALHTADDIGPVGPDAVHGWGLLNAKRAARTLSEDGGFSLIQELTLGQGQSYSVEVEANGLEDLIASISWTDPAGSTTTNLNDPTPRLVNDLDIKITKSVNEWFPWRLTGVDTNANDSDNLVDPFERIEVTNPTGIYTVTVTHKGTLTNLSQNYSLIITGIQPDCTNAQIPSNIQASVTTTTAVINWNHFIPEIYDLRYRETGESPWSEISDLTISSTTLVDLKYSTEYELQIRSRYPDCTPTAYSNSIFFTTAPLEYCDAGGNGVSDSALGEKLSNVSFNTIDNNSTSTEGYEDFTSIYTTLAIGETYSFEATISNAFPTDQIIVWIDYNQDGDFEDVGELVYTSPLGVGPHSKDDIVISSNALLGMTGMRVRLHDSSVSFQPNNTPCGDSGYGQVEDYTVVIYEENQVIQPDANNILYVNKNVTGGNGDGSSWANAVPELADALKWAKNNEDATWATIPLQIWVAGGTYNPLYSPEDGVNFGTDQARDNSFLLVNNVQLYGGFAGTETSLAARDLSIVGNASVLSGDIGALNDTSDNTYHVMVSSGNIGSGLLNGFTITEGNANGSSFIVVNGTSIQRRRGGGMNTRNSSPSLLNIIINGNNASELGGGMFFRNGSFIVGSPTITNCTFTENTAGNAGGGICLDGTDGTTITNTIFEGNTANNSGGGMANLFCSPTIINTTFSENTANNDGGGIFNFEFSSPTITNCVFWENEANGNTTSSSASVTNFSGSNSTITFSLIANSGGSASWDSSLGTDSGNNIDLDPLFVDVVANDFSLQKGSLAINAGNNTAYQTATGNSPASDTDINGNARLFQSTIDMGAYEADFNQSQWRGTTSEDWSTNTNWDEGFPDDQSVALIRDISLNTPKIDAPTIAEVRDLILAENAALNVQGVLKVNAEIQNNGQVTFTSNEMKTGQLDEFSGTYSGTGTVEVERFIPAGDNDKRAFRFLSSSVNSTGSINTNWQEGAATWNENPNPGFGTHITGSLAGADGFDASGSGNPSLFLYPSAAQTWSSIANTDVKALEAGAAYRLMVRGDRSIDLTSNAADPTNTILRSKGSLVFGTIDMSSELAQGADQFSLVGNPYQSVVDFSAVNKNNLRDYVYVWDASLTGANGRGAYVIVEVSSNSIVEAPAASSSSATKFIAPNQAFFVRNTSAGSPTLVFEETNKATAQAQVEVFNTYADFYINSRLYKTADLQNGNTEADAIGLRFSSQHTTEADEEDAEKLANPDENYAIINNGLRAIDKQNLPEDGHEIELFTNSYTTTAYSLTFAMDNLPEGLEVFLNDSYLNTQTQLSAESVYDFTVDANIPASMAFNRFSLSFDTTTLGVEDNVFSNFSLYPNPTTDGKFTVQTQGFNTDTTVVKMYNLLGQEVYNQKAAVQSNGEIRINAGQLPAGMYVVELQEDEVRFVGKLMVE